MKLCVVSTLALLVLASNAVGQDVNDVHRETQAFWDEFVEDMNSFPSAAPSPGPSPEPSEAPSAAPSPAPSAAPSPAPSSAPSAGPTPAPVSGEPTPAPSPAPSAEPSAPPSPSPSASPSSGPTPAPASIEPTPAPSPAPSAEPSAAPSAGPTPAPVSGEPTPAPSPAPSAEPSAAPSATPSAPPSPAPVSGEPTPAPSPAPSAEPSAEPSPAPSPAPSAPPSGLCVVTVELNCTSEFEGATIPCEEIPDEENIVCTCPDCVRELLFVYTGAPCNGYSPCTDTAVNPFTAGVTITNADVPTEVLVSGEFDIGDIVTIVPATGQSCIPDRLAVTIMVPMTTVTQAFEIDSSCDGGRGLVLLDDYASFESVGYSCDATDEHNCLLDVLYEVEVCNAGSGEETVYTFDFTLNGTVTDLTVGVAPEDLVLLTDECYLAAVEQVVERCAEREYVVTAIANATNPFTGPICEAEDTLTFDFTLAPLPPTAMPSPSPSSAPSPVPTTGCEIEVALGGCFNFTPIGDNNCEGRPVEMTFRYNGGDCSQSDNLQDRQKYDCFDIEPPGPPPTTAGTESYITVTQLGGGDVFFEGLVAIGDLYTLNANRVFDKLAADLNITIYDPAIGINGAGILQTLFVHMSCSQPLFLKDRFGASQVVQWIEDSGRNVTCFQETETGSLVVSLNASSVDGAIELLEMVVISNTQDEPINYTEDVAGIILEPGGDSIELPPINVTVDLTQRVRYTFFTTVVGRAVESGVLCNGFDFTECIAGIGLPPFFPTLAPTPSPTVTPFPTPDPEFTTCIVRGEIECLVTRPQGLTCETLEAPTDLRCTDGAELSLLVFQITGPPSCGDLSTCVESGNPLPEQFYLEITDCETTGFFQGTANIGDNITINSRGNFLCDTFEVSFQTVDFDEEEEANSGEEIIAFSLPTACLPVATDPLGWTLGTNYGGLTLTQYNSDLDGIQAESATVTMNYVAANPGQFDLIIDSAILDSSFSPSNPTQIVPTPFELRRRNQVSISSQTVIVDLIGASGTTFDFALNISATSDNVVGLPCDDFRNFTFTI